MSDVTIFANDMGGLRGQVKENVIFALSLFRSAPAKKAKNFLVATRACEEGHTASVYVYVGPNKSPAPLTLLHGYPKPTIIAALSELCIRSSYIVTDAVNAVESGKAPETDENYESWKTALEMLSTLDPKMEVPGYSPPKKRREQPESEENDFDLEGEDLWSCSCSSHDSEEEVEQQVAEEPPAECQAPLEQSSENEAWDVKVTGLQTVQTSWTRGALTVRNPDEPDAETEVPQDEVNEPAST